MVGDSPGERHFDVGVYTRGQLNQGGFTALHRTQFPLSIKPLKLFRLNYLVVYAPGRDFNLSILALCITDYRKTGKFLFEKDTVATTIDAWLRWRAAVVSRQR